VSVQILQGDVRQQLATLPAESVQCVVTSPPYYGLRAYGTNPQVWGGDPEHGHVFGDETVRNFTAPAGSEKQASNAGACDVIARSAHCPCGAWRGELGSEPTPALFIEHLVSIFDEVRRVMRPDGVLFVNLGDSYAGSGKGPTGKSGIGDQEWRQGFRAGSARADGVVDGRSIRNRNGTGPVGGIPAKNLLLIPERFAIAMQDAGWIVRSRIAWCKTSAMPESVRDRPTSAWEHIWMFTRSARYFWDQEAVRSELKAPAQTVPSGFGGHNRNGGTTYSGNAYDATQLGGANLRNYWLLGPEPSREEHYAAFPSEIPRRCILAATSEKGQCPACGSPWVRSTEITYTPRLASPKSQVKTTFGERSSGDVERGSIRPQELPYGRASKNVQTTGWQAGCQCDAGDPVPQLVLDPFLGSGTTALVADQLGRNAVGIELNPEYAEMARRRITNDCPMFTDVEVAG
jgi:DNA modification methylase